MKKPWLSMKTAPRDGSWVLLAEEGRMTGYNGIRYFVSRWDSSKKGCWVGDGSLSQIIPLGWLPIPPFKP